MSDEFATLGITCVEESTLRNDVVANVALRTSREDIADQARLQEAWASLAQLEAALADLAAQQAKADSASSEGGRLRFAVQSTERAVQRKVKEVQTLQIEVEQRRQRRLAVERARQRQLQAMEDAALRVAVPEGSQTSAAPSARKNTCVPLPVGATLPSGSPRPESSPPLPRRVFSQVGCSDGARTTVIARRSGLAGASRATTVTEEYAGGELLPSLNQVKVGRTDVKAWSAKYEDDGDPHVFEARRQKRMRLEALAALAASAKDEAKERVEPLHATDAVKREREVQGMEDEDLADVELAAQSAVERADECSSPLRKRGGRCFTGERQQRRGPPPANAVVIDIDAAMEGGGDEVVETFLAQCENRLKSTRDSPGVTRAVKTESGVDEEARQGDHPRGGLEPVLRGSCAALNEAELARVTASYRAPTTVIGGDVRVASLIYDRLLDYQKVGVEWLVQLHLRRCGGILGDEMGLGKTIQVATLINALHESKQLLGPCLIVAPLTVLRQWVLELHRWAPHARACVMHESSSSSLSRADLIRSVRGTPAVVLITYASLRQNYQQLHTAGFHYVILDEGHKISNPEATVTIAAKTFTTPHRLILSGSPIQNTLKELWCLFDFVKPGLLGTLPKFIEEFEGPINASKDIRASSLMLATAVECARALQNRISAYLLRRLKRHVNTMLPSKYERVIRCPLSDEQLEAYVNILTSPDVQRLLSEVLVGARVAGLLNRDGRDAQGSLHVAGPRFQLMRSQSSNAGLRVALFRVMNSLRQVCNHTDIYALKVADSEERVRGQGGGAPRSGREGTRRVRPAGASLSFRSNNPVNYNGSAKLKTLRLMMSEWKRFGHRVLVFSQTRMMLDIIENMCEQESFRYLRMDGTTDGHYRQELMDRFNGDESIFAALLTTRVGGIGVNLVGADRVVIFDPDWNPVTDEQARERAWRIGQTREVCVYRMIASGTVEETILRRQLAKTYVTDKVLKDPTLQRFFHQHESLAETFFLGTEYDARIPAGKKHVMAAQELMPLDEAATGEHQWSDEEGGDDQRATTSETEMRGGGAATVPSSDRRERQFGLSLRLPQSGDGSPVVGPSHSATEDGQSAETQLLRQLVDGRDVAISGQDRVSRQLARMTASQAMLRVTGEALLPDQTGHRLSLSSSVLVSGLQLPSNPYSLLRRAGTTNTPPGQKQGKGES